MNGGYLINKGVEAYEESVRYFSAKNKAERERWVVEILLKNMNVLHPVEDITSPDDDPPDVNALGGRFEVKEILDQGRERHREYKEALERARTAMKPTDLLTEFAPVDSSVEEIYQRCLAKAQNLDERYPDSVRSALDLLFYVNLQDVFDVHEEPFPNTSTLVSLGWRSVTFVKGHIACCFYASAVAPAWLQERAGRVLHRVSE